MCSESNKCVQSGTVFTVEETSNFLMKQVQAIYLVLYTSTNECVTRHFIIQFSSIVARNFSLFLVVSMVMLGFHPNEMSQSLKKLQPCDSDNAPFSKNARGKQQQQFLNYYYFFK